MLYNSNKYAATKLTYQIAQIKCIMYSVYTHYDLSLIKFGIDTVVYAYFQ